MKLNAYVKTSDHTREIVLVAECESEESQLQHFRKTLLGANVPCHEWGASVVGVAGLTINLEATSLTFKKL